MKPELSSALVGKVPRAIARPHIGRRRTFKRGEAAIEDQLEIAEVALGKDESRELLSLDGILGLARQIASEEVLEDAAVGSVGHGCLWDGGVKGIEGQGKNRARARAKKTVSSQGMDETKRKGKEGEWRERFSQARN